MATRLMWQLAMSRVEQAVGSGPDASDDVRDLGSEQLDGIATGHGEFFAAGTRRGG